MKINNLSKFCNIKLNNINDNQPFKKNNNSSDYIYVKQSKLESLKAPIVGATFVGNILYMQKKEDDNHFLSHFVTSKRGKWFLGGLGVTAAALASVYCIDKIKNNKKEKETKILKIKQNENETKEKTLKKYLFNKSLLYGSLCAALNILFTYLTVRPYMYEPSYLCPSRYLDIFHNSCRNNALAGIGVTILSLIVGASTYNNLKKINNQKEISKKG